MITCVTPSVSIMEDETAESVTKHLIETYQQYAVRSKFIKRVLTDSKFVYQSKTIKEPCESLNVNRVFTQPYTP